MNYFLELIEEHDSVNFYSIHLEHDALSELEKFFEKFPLGSEYDEDIDKIIVWLDKIGELGAKERYFRYEGKYGDGVSAIPIETNNLRLYCIRLSGKILVFGNGGVKNTPKLQDDSSLTEYVKMLIDTSRFIQSRINDGTICLIDKEIVGNLNFYRDEKE